MNFLNPAALWFTLLAIPIIVFYLLKIRRKEVEISSTLLWRLALRDQQANAPWQKLRRNLLLLLQLIILAMMVLAISRLAFPLASISSGAVVILIDGSASMLARDEAPDRFARAVEIAQDLVRTSGADAAASAILVTQQPRILFPPGTDKKEAAEILGATQASVSEADWGAAFSLASGLVADAEQAEKTTFVILSDGGLPTGELPPLPGVTQFIPIGRSGDNLAVSNLAARVVPSGDSAELFVRVTNYGSQERAALLTIKNDGVQQETRRLRLAPAASATFLLTGLAVTETIFEAGLMNIQADLPLDAFTQDDTAYTVLMPPEARDVLLVSEGNLFLERLLLLFPNLSASKTSPDENGKVNLGSAAFDLYVFDGVLLDGELPDGQIMLIHPPENDLVQVTGDLTAITQPRTTDNPLAAFIEWKDVNVFETRALVLPAWGRPLVTSDETPLVFIGEKDGRRIAVVGFDLHATDLPLQVAFPILFANLFDFLAPQGMVASPNVMLPGSPVAIRPPAGTRTLAIERPDGEAVIIADPGVDLLYTGTDQIGIYTVRAANGNEFQEGTFSVNLFSDSESDIAVKEEIVIGRSTVAASGEKEVSSREVWGWLIGLALAFLLIEWYAYHRRLA